MLIALFTILLLGGGADSAVLNYISETKANVANVITNPDAESAAKTILGEMKSLTKAQNKSANSFAKQLQKELGEHDDASDAIDAVLDQHLESLHKYNEDMIDLRFQLKDQLSREEWEALFG